MKRGGLNVVQDGLKTEAGGVWFVALGSQHHTVTGTPFSGIYDDGAQRPAISQWVMTKVE